MQTVGRRGQGTTGERQAGEGCSWPRPAPLGAPRGGCPAQQGWGSFPTSRPAQPWVWASADPDRSCLCDPTSPSPVTVEAGVVQGGGWERAPVAYPGGPSLSPDSAGVRDTAGRGVCTSQEGLQDVGRGRRGSEEGAGDGWPGEGQGQSQSAPTPAGGAWAASSTPGGPWPPAAPSAAAGPETRPEAQAPHGGCPAGPCVPPAGGGTLADRPAGRQPR